LRDHDREFVRRGVRVAVVTFENDFFARAYAGETGLAWPILIDETRSVYAGYGMLQASFWDVWGPKTWWAYLREFARGGRLTKSGGDVCQRGGDVLIDPDGIVRLHHVGAGPADRPAVKTILAKIPEPSRPGRPE
jgi:hypothetical protein